MVLCISGTGRVGTTSNPFKVSHNPALFQPRLLFSILFLTDPVQGILLFISF